MAIRRAPCRHDSYSTDSQSHAVWVAIYNPAGTGRALLHPAWRSERFMPTDVIMPQMGESIFEGTITKWFKKVGEPVEKDEPLFEISTDKVDAEIPSEAAGVLIEIKFPEGATVGINTVVAVLGEKGSVAKATTAPEGRAEKSATAEGTQAPLPSPQQPQEIKAPPAVARATSTGIEIVMPQMGESIFEGTITKWLKKVGDTVEKDEPLFEISTDKVDAEIPSSVAGVLTEIRATEGETVQIKMVVAVIGGSPASTQSAAARPSMESEKVTSTIAASGAEGAVGPTAGGQVVAAGAKDCERARHRSQYGGRLGVRRTH